MASSSSKNTIEKQIGREYPPDGKQAAIEQLRMMLSRGHKAKRTWRRGV